MTTEEKLNYLNRKIEAAGFDNYLIVLSKGGDVWTKHSGKLSAMGMCKMVENDIKKSWNKDNDGPINFRFSDN